MNAYLQTWQELVISEAGETIRIYPMLAIDSRMYILTCGEDALVVDPNTSPVAIAFLQQAGIKHCLVLLTHEHFDHISGVNLLREKFPVQVVCTELCAKLIQDPSQNMAQFWEAMLIGMAEPLQKLGRALGDTHYVCTADIGFQGQYELDWHGHSIRMVETPGHSPGSCLIFLGEEILFTGDSLVNGAGVILRLPGGSKRAYLKQTRPILEALEDDLLVLPGHGEPASLGELREYMELFKPRTAAGKER